MALYPSLVFYTYLSIRLSMSCFFQGYQVTEAFIFQQNWIVFYYNICNENSRAVQYQPNFFLCLLHCFIILYKHAHWNSSGHVGLICILRDPLCVCFKVNCATYLRPTELQRQNYNSIRPWCVIVLKLAEVSFVWV